MKEVVKWDKNPRDMWVWNDDEGSKVRRKVVAIADGWVEHPVVAIDGDGNDLSLFRHCAGIETYIQPRLMTNKELSRWLREKPDREWMESGDVYIHSSLGYTLSEQDEPVRANVRVREGDGPWYVPWYIPVKEEN